MDKTALSFTDRSALLTEFKLTQLDKNAADNKQQQWDVIVVGGGIVGAGILQEATRRGLKTLLIEQKDFAWGTSSRSSKMVHGGLRYVAQGDLKLTKHSLAERERLLKEAPGLINRMGYYFVIRQWQFPGRFIMSTLLRLYDYLAGIKDHQFFDHKKLLDKFPTLAPERLKGACYYTDSVVDDARLVMRVLQESVQSGAQVLNYVKAKALIKDPKTKQIIGVIIQDNSSKTNNSTASELITLTSSVVINATGAWADKLRSEVINQPRIRPLRGSHLIVAQTRLAVAGALTILHPTDKRPVFIFPWEGVTVIGTTDLDHHENLDHEAKISQTEVDYLLQAITQSFPKNNITLQDVISTFSGVRPVISSDRNFSTQTTNTTKAPSKERRDHAIWAENALITASGGKLTTFRLTAIEALNAAMPWLKSNHNDKKQTTKGDHVFTHYSLAQLFKNSKHEKVWLQRLVGRYGNKAPILLGQAKKEEHLLIKYTQFCLAECRWAIKNEAVVHLDDLLLRRTRLGLLLKNGAQELFAQLADIFQQELGWNKTKWQDEVTRYRLIWQQSYYLPMPAKHTPD
ncbi:MAG: glycerol-3-phosphate dehydrogenase/oxidase [Colwellia sp.]|nr:glycerol-3-phosphate dehydrogenase/oxidase [Colwellia sp.]